MKNPVRVKLDDGAETTVGAAYAESHKLKVLDKAAVDRSGRALPAKPAIDLRGKELDEALGKAGLSKGGTAAEKRDRLAEHEASATSGGSNNTEEI